ncbi:MAG: MFS transporter [Mycobacteriales bacterium]
MQPGAGPPPSGAAGTTTATDAKWGRYGKRPLVVLCLVGLVDAIDRGILPAVIEPVQRELGFSDFQSGLLYTALIVAALLVAIPGGALADRSDRRSLMRGVLILWAAATTLAGLVQSYWQLLTVRAALGVGDALNDPAAQSLVADYYPPEIRGRAYAWQRVVPTVGVGLGTVIGGGLLALFGWRVAIIAVGVPGVLVALLVKRLPLPPRGEADAVPVLAGAPLTTRQSVAAVLQVPSLRALLLAVAFINGVLSALGFWGIAYHVRASGMSESSAPAIAGSVILFGAILGGIGGGIATDKLRGRFDGGLMLLAAIVTAVGTVLLFISFLDGIPVYGMRLPLQLVGVALVVSSLPPITVIGAEVVPATLRGTSFGVTKLCANVLGAIFPPAIGLIADAHQITISTGAVKGDLGLAFRLTMGIVLIGSALLFYGRRHLDDDVRRALEVTANASS